MKLYEITNELERLTDTEELSDEDIERIQALEVLAEDKAISAHHVDTNLSAEITSLKEEEARLRTTRRALEHNRDYLRAYISAEMGKQGLKSIGRPGHRFTRVANRAKTPEKKRIACYECGRHAMAEFYKVTGSQDVLCPACADKRIQEIVDQPITFHLRTK